jgi:outer membrane protein assembly factor BamB
VRAGASGDVTLKANETSNTGVAWRQSRAGLEMASPIVYQGYLWVLSERGGFVTCYESATGKQIYRERIPAADAFWASPWAYDGKVFCLDQRGGTYLLPAGPKFQVLLENRLDDRFWASPAMAGGSLILRGSDNVYCIRK